MIDRKRLHLLIIPFVTLLVYLPAVFAGVSQTDDLKMITGYLNRPDLDLIDLFIRKKSYYWRPLNSLTYVWDGYLWGHSPSFMHLENILFHALNALLVYLIIAKSILSFGREEKFWPLTGALLFALHPIATESVCWISGRTDLLAGLFVLAAYYLLLGKSRAVGFKRQLAAVCLFLLACLCKETALFFFGGAVWLIWVQQRQALSRFSERVKSCFAPWALWSLGAAVYLGMRSYALGRGDSGIKTAKKLAGASDGLLDMLRVTIKVFGFYFKKFIMPHPLNYGILEVSSFYYIPGILLLIFLVFWVWRQNFIPSFFITGCCLVLPALLVVFGNMAWTPVAERYLYMASAPGVVGLILLTAQKDWSVASFKRLTLIIVLIIFVAGTTVLYRSWQWYDGKALLADTIKQSPDFLPMYVDLAAMEIHDGNLAVAEDLLRRADLLDKENKYVPVEMSLATLKVKQKNFTEARDILRHRLESPHKSFMRISEMLVRVNLQYLSQVNSGAEKKSVQEDILNVLIGMGRKSGHPFLRYRIGKAYLALDYNDRAGACFEEAYRGAPEGSHYKNPALILSGKLKDSKSDRACVPAAE